MHNINLRLANIEDLTILSEIYASAYNQLNIGENWDSKSSYQLIKFLYNSQPDLFFIAEYNDKIVGGIVAIVRGWWDGNHLIDGEVFIHPDHQKKGLGMKLIEKLLTTAEKNYSVNSWDTYTHTVYKFPLEWYKSIGFEQTKERTMITGDVKKVLTVIKSKTTK